MNLIKELTKEQKKQQKDCLTWVGFDNPIAVCGIYLQNREICPKVCSYALRMKELDSLKKVISYRKMKEEFSREYVAK